MDASRTNADVSPAPACPGCDPRDRPIAELVARIAVLEQKLEAALRGGKRRAQGSHPLQTSDALGCCASQVGPGAQVPVVMLNKEMGLSQGKISRFFQRLFGLKLTRGGSRQIILRAAERCQDHRHAIVKRVPQGRWIVPDETGWRIGGLGVWMHAAVGEDAVAHLIAWQRGCDSSRRSVPQPEASSLLIGEDYAGTPVHGGWASYDRFWRATHQTCLARLLCRCKELLDTPRRGAVVFPRNVKALLQESLEIRDHRDAHKITLTAARRWADELQKQMTKLVTPVKHYAANECLSAYLQRHDSQPFTFLRHHNIDATNHRAEQAIRPAVANRTVWGGNRTDVGAVAQAILMTVLFTAAGQGRKAMEFATQALRATPNHRPFLLPDTG